MENQPKIAVIIPAYRVRSKIVSVVSSLQNSIHQIIVVDDKCPEESGKFLAESITDKRVIILYHEENKGVGGALKTGFKEALAQGADIIVKLDGDGQMDASFIPELITPIVEGQADFTKGNRFYNPRYIRQMPKIRLFGNSCLSLINKFVTGYWSIMDPTNGFIAISAKALQEVEFDKLSNRYFFESDLLYRLSLQASVVVDIPMPAKYEDENSSLNIGKVIVTFIPKYIARYFKRIIYLYFVRDFNAGTLQLVFGLLLFWTGFIFGIYHWMLSIQENTPASAGTIMLAGLPVILGFQLLLGFLMYDINNQPKR
jgi:glycosyltransferase involved in cell wall biosynthesis